MGRKRVLTQEQVNDAADMYSHGCSTQEIADRFGCSSHTVRQRLKDAGVVFKPRNRLERHVDVDDVVEQYQNGATLMEIAAQYGCSWMTIQRRLVGVGADLHAVGCRYYTPMTDTEKRLSCNEQARRRRAAISSRYHSGPACGLSWRDIAKRDHMRCQICGCKVDPNDKWKNEKGRWCFGRHYPTIDHIIALNNGGTDTYDNVQLACKHCNSKKGHKGQLRMAI